MKILEIHVKRTRRPNDVYETSWFFTGESATESRFNERCLGLANEASQREVLNAPRLASALLAIAEVRDIVKHVGGPIPALFYINIGPAEFVFDPHWVEVME